MNTEPDKQRKRRGTSASNARHSEDPSSNLCQAPDAGNLDCTVRHSHSAGGVAYRKRTVNAFNLFEVALIASDQEGRRWQLPKGRLYPTEKPLAAALREVEEETGLDTEFESFLKTVHYEYHGYLRPHRARTCLQER